MRVVLLSCLALLALAVTGSARPAPTAGASGFFVVRPDPRACPSPTCGGYWVALANHARTTCADGLLRPRCYVASAENASTRRAVSVPAGALARALLASTTNPDWGRLGVLRVTDTWAAATPSAPKGGFFRVRDTGVRCLRRPCFSYRAVALNSQTAAIRVSSFALGPAGEDPSVRGRAQAALSSSAGVLASGRFDTVGDGGRVLLASQLYLTP